MSNSKIQPAVFDDVAPPPPTKLPIEEIPGSYGIPFISAIKDRLDYYYDQGEEKFFQSRRDKYGSTVYRVNMPPGPFMASDPRVIVLLDAKSFPILFDVSKVEKKNLFTGTYMPSTSLTGGYRACSYLDPSEAKHTQVKTLLFNLLSSRKSNFISSFHSSYTALFSEMEFQLESSSNKGASFNKLNDDVAFDFLGEAYFGSRPSANSTLGNTGPFKTTKWLFLQLCPILTLGLPKILEEVFLHTFPLPPCLVKADYKALYSYFESAAGPILDNAEVLGLSRKEACHNLLFATCFNSYGGMKVLFPVIFKWLAHGGPKLHSKLAQEIRAAVEEEGGGSVTLAALEKMELTQSVVYESLRMDPPVKFQYAKAKMDLVIESHEKAYEVKKGEMLFGYQPFATRDERVFPKGGEFVADRFVGEEGKKLLKYVVWSNGPETESPTVGNKQCPGKDFVGLVGRLLVVEFFLRYDTFTAEAANGVLGTEVTVTALKKATTTT